MAPGHSGPADRPIASVVLFALPREAGPLRSTMDAFGRGAGVSIAISGMGAMNSRLAAERLVRGAGVQPMRLLIAGFAGALAPGIEPGDLIVATEVLGEAAEPVLRPDARLMETAGRARGLQTAHRGGVVSTPHVLTRKDEKQLLHATSHAAAVDMESYAAASVAIDAAVPWLCIRAITDRCDENLPVDFNRLGPSAASPAAVARFAALRPASWPGLVRLGGASSRAARSLAIGLHGLLCELHDAQ